MHPLLHVHPPLTSAPSSYKCTPSSQCTPLFQVHFPLTAAPPSHTDVLCIVSLTLQLLLDTGLYVLWALAVKDMVIEAESLSSTSVSPAHPYPFLYVHLPSHKWTPVSPAHSSLQVRSPFHQCNLLMQAPPPSPPSHTEVHSPVYLSAVFLYHSPFFFYFSLLLLFLSLSPPPPPLFLLRGVGGCDALTCTPFSSTPGLITQQRLCYIVTCIRSKRLCLPVFPNKKFLSSILRSTLPFCFPGRLFALHALRTSQFCRWCQLVLLSLSSQLWLMMMYESIELNNWFEWSHSLSNHSVIVNNKKCCKMLFIISVI